MKVALVHDYLKEYGGAERVLEALHEIWPQAPIYTAYYDPQGLGSHAEKFNLPAGGWDIRTSVLQKIPFAGKLLSPFRIFAPLMFESFDLSQYDLVISSCSIYFSKSVITKPEVLHLSYIHTPPRYLYGYTTSFNYRKNPFTRVLGELANHFLRIYDFETSQRPDILVANSKNVAARIQKFYRRDSEIIYPPVNVTKLSTAVRSLAKVDRKYYLSVGRLVRGKGIDIIVEACRKLRLPLKVIGSGSELKNLQTSVDRQQNVEFLGSVNDEKLAFFYANAMATIVASEDEDFGIVPVESQACGTPVIAVRVGGYLETVIEGKTGEFFNNATVVELMKVLESFDPRKYKPEDCRKNAAKFSQERFKKEILELVDKHLKL